MSGSGFGFWPVLTKDRARRLTNSLARRLGCSSRSSVELIRCLQGISGSWIIMIQLKLFVSIKIICHACKFLSTVIAS